MNQLFSAQNLYSDNPLTSMLMGNKLTDVMVGGTSWEWDLKGANTRPLVIVENVLPAAETTPGKYRRTFMAKFDEPFWLPGDIICPGTSDKRYQCRVMDDKRPHGDGFIYTLRGMWEDDAFFLPVKFLAQGTQWGKMFAQYEEAAEQSGSTQYAMPIALANKMSKYRKQYRVTDYASTEVLAVKIPDSNGQLHDSWIRYAEVEYWKQWYRELERGFWYSRSTDTVLGANGRPVRSGAGILEQLESSHSHTYSFLSTKLIEEFLMDVFYSRVKPGKGRRVKAFAGEYGMLNMHRAITDWMSKRGIVLNAEVFTNKVGSEYHTNAFETGYQMVRYNMANGSSLEVFHNPLADDRDINFEIDPVSGFPVESQRIIFLDFVSDTGSSDNIKIVSKKDGFASTYVEGLYGPLGPKRNGSSAHSGAYYELHVEKSCGSHITDVGRCGQLILGRA